MVQRRSEPMLYEQLNAAYLEEDHLKWIPLAFFGVVVVLLVMAALLLGGCGSALDGAQDLERAGDYQGAEELYRGILAESPDHLGALRGCAVALYLQHDFDGALPLQEKVVALDPTDVQTRIELGFNYLSHQQEPTKAEGVLREAAELEPTAKHLTFLAQAAMAAGDAVGAEASLRQALSIDPQYPHAYMVLIRLLEGQGRDSEAAAVNQAANEAGVKLD